MVKKYVGGGRAEMACPKAGSEPGHKAYQFVWQDTSDHVEHHQAELTCFCGELMVHVGGTDPYKHPFVEVEGTPHGA